MNTNNSLPHFHSPTPRLSPSPTPPINPLIAKQSSFWSKSILWSLIAVTTAVVTWANVAKIEEVITVQGKLEPQGKVKELKVPLQGVVNEIHVEDGDLLTSCT